MAFINESDVKNLVADLAAKAAITYVDTQIAAAKLGQNAKEACDYATTAALPAIIYNNGSSGVGATLTGVAFGIISIDSATPTVGQRILVKNQVSTFQNGIYTVTVVGTIAIAFVLTRAVDFNQTSQITSGDTTFIKSGTANSATTWAVSSADSPVMGTDPITFVQIAGQGSFIAGNNISITGTTISVTTALSNGTTATTQTAGDNSTKLATTAYADAAIAAQAKKTILGSFQSIV